MFEEVDTSDKRPVQLGVLEKYGLLLMGIFLLILSGGRFVTPTAAFLAPLLLLRFTRNTEFKFGMAVLYFLLFISLLVRLHDYLAVPRPSHLIYIALFALIALVPYALDRKLCNRLPKALTPFVLPCAFVVLTFAMSFVFPFGTMADKAYTQVGNAELLQLLSITGTHGVTFLMFWFAAAFATLWDSGFVWRRCRGLILPMVLCMIIVFVAGGFRIIFDENESLSVRIAGVIGDHTALNDSLRTEEVEGGYAGLLVTGTKMSEPIGMVLDKNIQTLFESTKIQALAGAQIVVWSEASAIVYLDNVDTLLSQASEVAKSADIYLAIALVVIDPSNETSPSAENKLVVFDRNGNSLGEYKKVQVFGKHKFVKGNEAPLVVQTDYGTLAFAIGFDLDFPRAIRKIGHADILIAPSQDWKTLSPHHSLMATYRSIENGMSLFRPTSQGVSLASDPHGRILARTDHFRSTQQSLVADVPTRGIGTTYTQSGDWFAWVNALWLFLLLAVAVWRQRKGSTNVKGDGLSKEERKDRSRITAIQWKHSERDNNLDPDP